MLDPFCGSGTLLVEAAAMSRKAVGVDCDPVAVTVTRAKTGRYNGSALRKSAKRVLTAAARYERPSEEYELRKFTDVTDEEYQAQLKRIRTYVPEIPNLLHWFRRYVVVDLARLRRAIDRAEIPTSHRRFFQVVFASIIRNASNADPVPVSGLEVTSWMKKREEAGRIVNPFALFAQALARALDSTSEFSQSGEGRAKAILGDSTQLGEFLHEKIDAVISSPPYHGAVDYYRRHTLEMYWLGHTRSQDDRLALRDQYIGQLVVKQGHRFVANAILKTALASRWERRIRKVSPERADSFHHYLVAMRHVFRALAKKLPAGAPAVLVVGHSAWNSVRIPTTALFAEIAGKAFRLDEVLYYPVRNRYMSYSRHNGADISTEYVLVFRRAGRGPSAYRAAQPGTSPGTRISPRSANPDSATRAGSGPSRQTSLGSLRHPSA